MQLPRYGVWGRVAQAVGGRRNPRPAVSAGDAYGDGRRPPPPALPFSGISPTTAVPLAVTALCAAPYKSSPKRIQIRSRARKAIVSATLRAGMAPIRSPRRSDSRWRAAQPVNTPVNVLAVIATRPRRDAPAGQLHRQGCRASRQPCRRGHPLRRTAYAPSAPSAPNGALAAGTPRPQWPACRGFSACKGLRAGGFGLQGPPRRTSSARNGLRAAALSAAMASAPCMSSVNSGVLVGNLDPVSGMLHRTRSHPTDRLACRQCVISRLARPKVEAE
jgi:hypothetical protein